MRRLIARLFVGAMLIALAGFGSSASAEVTLNNLFSAHAVLQREIPTPVWGTAAAGEKVAVSFAGQQQSATADKQGRWQMTLSPLKAGGPHVLTVAGTNKLEVADILVGEVWLCSGQSNMAWRVSSSLDAAKEIAAADYPQIRMYHESSRGANEPQTQTTGQWNVSSPATAGGFSASAYFFGRELHKQLGVPVGLINSSVGGTPIEAWTSGAAQEELYQLPAMKALNLSSSARQGNLFNGKIAPLAPYAVRGAIWYQGEANRRGAAEVYGLRLLAMIADWRAHWKQEQFDFLTVQLPNFTAPQTEPSQTDGWVRVQEGQLKSLTAENTGLAVTIDIGEEKNIHPKNKQEVGRRLALWALGTTYGKEIVYSGPLYKELKIDGDQAIVAFKHVGEGLVARDSEKLTGFAIAGKDKKFVWADAKIDGDKVILSSPMVKNPMAVRYAWAANPKFNLYNQAGLPAAPFRTDDWEE